MIKERYKKSKKNLIKTRLCQRYFAFIDKRWTNFINANFKTELKGHACLTGKFLCVLFKQISDVEVGMQGRHDMRDIPHVGAASRHTKKFFVRCEDVSKLDGVFLINLEEILVRFNRKEFPWAPVYLHLEWTDQ